MSEVSETDDFMSELSDKEKDIIRAYMVFSNGDGLTVLEDLMYTFYDMKSAPFNEELQEIPHPYQEYVVKGCRMVMSKIMDMRKIAEENR
jgi:hypothetical protein